MTTPPKDIGARLLERVEFDTNGGCWLWSLAPCSTGYCELWLGGKRIRAHRASYEVFNGPIQKGLHVLHKCDVRACINPAHLFLGTDDGNAYDRSLKGRSASKLTFDQVREVYASCEPTQEAAERLGISIVTVRHIRSGRRWSNITGAPKGMSR